MKRTLLIYMAALLTMLVTVQSLCAQQRKDALYIYRNDGGFDAFFYGDIERIAYSNIDTLGIEHEDFVVQEIYAHGEVFRIPISAIDSVGFITPDNKYKDDVAHTATSDMWSYVTSVDSLTLYLAANTPSGMLPQIGQKLVYDKVSEVMGSGFMGKVKRVTKGSNGYAVECNILNFTDVFDRFTGKIALTVMPEDEGNAASRKRSAISSIFDVPVDKQYAKNITLSLAYSEEDGFYQSNVTFGGSMGMGVTLKNEFDLRGVFKVDKDRGLVFSGKQFGDHEWTIAYDLAATVNYSRDFALKIPFPIPSCPLARFQINAGIALNISGSIGLTGNIGLKFKSDSDIEYQSGLDKLEYVPDYGVTEPQHSKRYDISPHFKDPQFTADWAKLYGKASARIGGFAELMLVLGTAGADLMSVGPRFEGGFHGEVSVDLVTLSDLAFWDYNTSTFLYKVMNRDATITSGLYVNAQAIEKILYSKKAQIVEAANFSEDVYGVVPTFFEPEAEYNEYSNFITADVGVDKQLLIKEPVGFAVYDLDKGKQIGKTVWFDKEYDGIVNSDGSYGPNCFDDYELKIPYKVYGGQKVRVFPTTKLFKLYELWGEPYVDMTITPGGSSTPEDLLFPQKGGTQEIMFFSNMPIQGVKVTVEEDADGKKNWMQHKVNWNESDTYWEYGVTVSENKTASERKATAVATAVYEDQKIMITVPIVQEGDDSKLLSVEPDTFNLPGYGKDFKNGLLPTKFTVRYAKDEGKEFTFTSSDPSWLTIADNWASQKEDGSYYKCERNFYVTPNPSFTTPRDGWVMVTMFLADGKTAIKRFGVHQEPMEPELSFEQPQLTLKAEDNDGAEWSDTKYATIVTNLRDKGIGTFIDHDGLSSSDWIEATVVNSTTVKVRAKAWNGVETREGNVVYTLYMKNGESQSCTLKVIQNPLAQNEVFTTNPRQIRLPAEGGELKVTFVAKDPKRPIDHVYEFNAMGSIWLGGAASGQSITLAATKPNPSPYERTADFAITMVMGDGSMVTQQFVAYQDGLGSGEIVEGLFDRVVLSLSPHIKNGENLYCWYDSGNGSKTSSWEKTEKYYVYTDSYETITYPSDTSKTVVTGQIRLAYNTGDGTTLWNLVLEDGTCEYTSKTYDTTRNQLIGSSTDYSYKVKNLPAHSINASEVTFWPVSEDDNDVISISKYIYAFTYDLKNYSEEGALISSKHYTLSDVDNIDHSLNVVNTSSLSGDLWIRPEAPHLELSHREDMEIVQTGKENAYALTLYHSPAVKRITFDSDEWIEAASSGFSIGTSGTSELFTVYVHYNDTKVDREGYVDITGHMDDGSTIVRTIVVKQPYDKDWDPTVVIDNNDKAELPPQAVIDRLKQAGMPIYTSNTPNRVNGTFEMTPLKWAYVYPDYGDDEDDLPTSMIFRFASGVSSKPVADFSCYKYHKRYGSSPAIDYHCSLTGDGNYFTLSNVKVNQAQSIFGGTYKETVVTVVSGEIIGDNLGNLYYAEVTLDKNDQIEYIEVYKDSDAVSDPCSWKPGSGSYWDARRK